VMLKEKAQGQQPEAESTNAPIRLRLLHSSDESPVMGLELVPRRMCDEHVHAVQRMKDGPSESTM
jgi:hypothetical protein